MIGTEIWSRWGHNINRQDSPSGYINQAQKTN